MSVTHPGAMTRPLTDAERSVDVVPRSRAIRFGPVSFKIELRTTIVCALMSVALVVVGCWSIMVGDFPLSVSQVVSSVFGDGGPDAEFIVQTLRLPRVLTAILVGAALGMSGAVFQSIARNPLGSPDIIGFQSGAAFGAVVVIVSVGGTSSQVAMGAVAGGLVTALLVYVLAWKRGLAASRLVLVGIGIGFTATAAVDYLITRANIYDVQRAAVWLTGSLNGRSWDDVKTVGLALVVLAPAILLAQRSLDSLDLGDDTAAALGLYVGRSKLVLILLAVCLAALAVAAAGLIAFIAFVAGPIARRLVDSPRACVIPAAFVGALVTTIADLVARRAFAPTELPVGIATAVIGAPYLIWLLSRRARTGAL
ncbi:MAG: iron chelate uptake ABC transporter family permease subunit [Ilumatobacteraceae bacterium]